MLFMKNFKLKHINILLLVYLITLTIFYFFHKGLPFQYLFVEVFNEDLSFLIKNKPEKISKFIVLFDKNFFYFLPIFPLFIYILILTFRFKEIILSTSSQYFKTGSDTLHLEKFNLNYLIAIAAASGLYLELMIIRLHSSFFQIFAFLKTLALYHVC